MLLAFFQTASCGGLVHTCLNLSTFHKIAVKTFILGLNFHNLRWDATVYSQIRSFKKTSQNHIIYHLITDILTNICRNFILLNIKKHFKKWYTFANLMLFTSIYTHLQTFQKQKSSLRLLELVLFKQCICSVFKAFKAFVDFQQQKDKVEKL